MSRLLSVLRERGEPIRFQELLERPWWRLEWIVTFLAMLELMREGSVVVLQEEPFGEIWLQRAPESGSESQGASDLEDAPAEATSAAMQEASSGTGEDCGT